MKQPRSTPQAFDEWFNPLRFGLLLGAALAIVFSKVVFGAETFIYRDFGVLAYPAIYHFHESFWRGELPLWNPLSNCGAPFLAQWGTMVLYPFSLFYLLLPLPWSANAFCLIHLFLAGFGMYWLARQWTNNGFAASIAGAAFVFNGVTFSCLLWPNYTVALGWMPWTVLCVQRAWSNGGPAIVRAAIVATLQMLSGVPELVLLTWLILGASCCADLFERRISFRQTLPRLMVIAILASGLMAAQLLPFFDLLSQSHRTLGVNASKWSLPLWGWANQFVPLLHCFLTPQGVFFQHGQEFMSSTYVGIIVVALGCFAPLMVRQMRVWLLAALVVFAFWMALGEAGGLFDVVKRALPLFGIMRYPVKFLLLVTFAMPLLAAYAIATIFKGESPRNRSLLWGIFSAWISGALLIGAILWRAYHHPFPLDYWDITWRSGVSRAAFLTMALALIALLLKQAGRKMLLAGQAALIAMVLLDALTHTPFQNPTVTSGALAPGLWTASTKLPPPKIGESRVMISPFADDRLLISRVPKLEHDFLGKRLALWSHLNLLEQIPKVGGSSTLQVREQMQVQSLLYASSNTALPRLMDFLSVSTMTAPGEVIEWVRRESHMPMATIGHLPIFRDSSNTLAALTSQEFDPKRTVYLPEAARGSVRSTNSARAKILSQRWSAHRVELETDAPESSLLVIAQTYYPAWRAEVDGTTTQLWRANHAFQALEVPAGRHQVVLRYEDRKFILGAAISIGTLCICGWIWRRQL